MNQKITEQNFNDRYSDPIERAEIDKFISMEMGRQMHRYIKAMKGTKEGMLRFEQRLKGLTVEQREVAIARYIDLNRHALDGLDLRMVLTRAVANYCDTFTYFKQMAADKRKLAFYLNRIRDKYIRLHKIVEKDGKFGMTDSHGRVLLPTEYDFLRTCYVYVDDLKTMPVIAQKNGKMGLVYPDGAGTEAAPFDYDDISLRDEYPYFEAIKGDKTFYLTEENGYKG